MSSQHFIISSIPTCIPTITFCDWLYHMSRPKLWWSFNQRYQGEGASAFEFVINTDGETRQVEMGQISRCSLFLLISCHVILNFVRKMQASHRNEESCDLVPSTSLIYGCVLLWYIHRLSMPLFVFTLFSSLGLGPVNFFSNIELLLI